MKRILIISPHYPPSNLAAVHRTRLFAMHLPTFGWEPTVLTVDEKYYEEHLDENLLSLIPSGQRIEKVSAFAVTQPRLVGDIGLRAFFQLYKRAKELIKKENYDFLYIPIPSFYAALLGRWLHFSTGIKYGVDYIDPWVHQFPGSEKKFSRHWFTTKLSGFLEPIAVKYVSLITGVAEKYYSTVFDRNPTLKESCVSGWMPYGGERSDHDKVKELRLEPYLFKPSKKRKLVYAGALLPRSIELLNTVFQVIAGNLELFQEVEFHFIGTGKKANDPDSYLVKGYAEKFGLWQNQVFEYPQRIPYLDVLVHLEAADGIFILGSTEPHYSPSKTYQGVLSQKPIMAILHEKSTAVDIISRTSAGMVFTINEENRIDKLKGSFAEFFASYRGFMNNYKFEKVDLSAFNEYSAKEVTRELATLLNRVTVQ